MKRKRCAAFLITGKACEAWAAGKNPYCLKHQHLSMAAKKVSFAPAIDPELQPGENGVLFDGQNGNLYTVNRVGAFILRNFSEGKTIARVAHALTRAYEVDPEEALADVIRFVDQLREMGVAGPDD